MRTVLPLFCAIGLAAGLAPSLEGQAGRTVRGSVVAAADGGPVADAAIRLLEPGRGRLTHSSPAGRFELRVPDGPVRLLVARIGYAPDTQAVAATVTTVVVRLQESAFALDPITVAAEPAYSAASSRAIRELDILLRPRETSQELLRLAPGLVIAQHAGGGKAEQIFLRAFDADHGTDIAVTVDGIPVNMVSHGHGQGYADLHFIMPEAVQLGQVRKGPYDAEDGNLATAGAIEFRTRDRRICAPERATATSVGARRTRTGPSERRARPWSSCSRATAWGAPRSWRWTTCSTWNGTRHSSRRRHGCGASPLP